MPLATAAENQALNAVVGTAPGASLAAYASLHSAYSATGANELTGGGYARQATTWATAGASGGSLGFQSGSTPSFSVPGGSTVAFIGLWSALTSGTFCGMGANGGNAVFVFTAATSGTFTAPTSAYTVGQQVVLWAGQGATTPTGVTVGTIYTIATASGATFTLTGVTISAAGSGLVQAIAQETYAAAGSFTLAADTLSILS